ncbi:MAG TPA: lyase family protein [Gaiellaceae bacterium]
MPFDALFTPPEVLATVSDQAWLRAMLVAERALAVAEAKVGVITRASAGAITVSCDPDRFDLAELVAEGRRAGNPAEPLVRALREAVGGDAAKDVHLGATSQDILDTAAALVAREATALIVADLDAVAAACAELADRHRSSVMAARTLLQQAVPTTFGLKAASWLVGVLHARGRISAARLPAQLGGAAGTLAALGDRGLEVLHVFATELSLSEPVVPWHTRRLPLAELGSAHAVAAGWAAKIALDLELLAQTEVGEVRMPANGGSSTMPHKRNPVGPALVRANAMRTRSAADLLVASLPQEHERAAGAWHAEWGALSDVLAGSGGATAWLRETLAGLEVDVERMRANVGEDTLSEAHRLGIDASGPEDYLGATDMFVDRALAFYGEA